MAQIGQIKYDIVWKWWTAPVFVLSELPILRDWKWLQDTTYKFVMRYGFTLKGFGK